MKKETSPKAGRHFGFWTATALVMGNMIGSGIFLLPSALGRYGGISMLGWLFTATGALMLSLLFVDLSKNAPRIGGPYHYAREAFGDAAGFIVAYAYWVSTLSGNAAISVALIGYLSVFIPALTHSPMLSAGAALINLWILTLINVSGLKISGRTQLALTTVKIAPLLLFAIYGLLYFDPGHFTPFNHSDQGAFSAVTSTAALTLWAFLGLESATIPAQSIRNAKHTIPRATIAGTLATTLIYLSATLAIMGVIAPDDLMQSNAPFADAASKLWGASSRYIIAAAGALVCSGALNGWILMQGQMPLAAAGDGLFPESFARVSGNGVPRFGLIISSLIVSLLLIMNFNLSLVRQFTFIILIATMATLIPYLISALARLKQLSGSNRRKTLIKKSIIPVLALLYSAWAVAGLGWSEIIWGLVFISTGLPIYWFLKRGLFKG